MLALNIFFLNLSFRNLWFEVFFFIKPFVAIMNWFNMTWHSNWGCPKWYLSMCFRTSSTVVKSILKSPHFESLLLTCAFSICKVRRFLSEKYFLQWSHLRRLHYDFKILWPWLIHVSKLAYDFKILWHWLIHLPKLAAILINLKTSASWDTTLSGNWKITTSCDPGQFAALPLSRWSENLCLHIWSQ